MLAYLARRLLYMVVALFVISIISFLVIEAPPGDFITTWISRVEAGLQGQDYIEMLRDRYGLNDPVYVRYFRWISSMLRGDFGYSLFWSMPVADILAAKLPYSLLINGLALILSYVVAIPIGIYSAVKQYSLGDYAFTFLGFLGLSIPGFLFALVVMYASYKLFGTTIGGLFSQQYVDAAWSLAKLADFLRHLAVPVFVVGAAGTAGLIRVMRATLLDELEQDYVRVARSKGLPEWRVILKYPVRVALNPILSVAGWLLPALVSGAIIIEVVLNLPTIGPVFLSALLSQDMQLAGAVVMLLSALVVIGTLASDLLLAIADPRIRYV